MLNLYSAGISKRISIQTYIYGLSSHK